MIRVAIAGASGRMGRSLLEALKTREDLSLAGAIVSPGDPVVGTDAGLFSVGKAIGVIATDTLDASSMPFDVLVDFTTPASALAHYKFCEMHASYGHRYHWVQRGSNFKFPKSIRASCSCC